jgi:hypothetical protein
LLADWFLEQVARPRRRYRRFVENDPARLKATIRAGDVLLVDGDQRVSEAVKYLTQSTWSHSALYIGDALLRRGPVLEREALRRFGREARYLIVEVLVERGVVVSPLVKYIDFNIRICRPVGLTPEDRETVLDHAISRVGQTYDRRNFLDIARYLLPFHLIPPRLGEDLLHFGSGKETETICSSLIAEAFGRVRFPILPVRRRRLPRTFAEKVRQHVLGRPTRYAWSGLLRARHPTLSVPRDFDLSPYFDVVKFEERTAPGFDYRKLEWEESRPQAAAALAPAGEKRVLFFRAGAPSGRPKGSS